MHRRRSLAKAISLHAPTNLYRPPGSPWNKIRPTTQAISIPKNVLTISQNAFRHSRLLSSIVFGIRNPGRPI
jgi:hypothetical protein